MATSPSSSALPFIPILSESPPPPTPHDQSFPPPSHHHPSLHCPLSYRGGRHQPTHMQRGKERERPSSDRAVGILVRTTPLALPPSTQLYGAPCRFRGRKGSLMDLAQLAGGVRERGETKTANGEGGRLCSLGDIGGRRRGWKWYTGTHKREKEEKGGITASIKALASTPLGALPPSSFSCAKAYTKKTKAPLLPPSQSRSAKQATQGYVFTPPSFLFSPLMKSPSFPHRLDPLPITYLSLMAPDRPAISQTSFVALSLALFRWSSVSPLQPKRRGLICRGGGSRGGGSGVGGESMNI